MTLKIINRKPKLILTENGIETVVQKIYVFATFKLIGLFKVHYIKIYLNNLDDGKQHVKILNK
ncbi:hypothetical protein MHBO_003968 [Bonamia ostreae]|uniref:Uncharacterized protein n=1 Tax=Bonamia ostreae TaxID=126728 RepID=A0ABV2AS12_9EUKA